MVVLSPNEHILNGKPCVPRLLHKKVQGLGTTEDISSTIILQNPVAFAHIINNQLLIIVIEYFLRKTMVVCSPSGLIGDTNMVGQ